MPPKRKGAAAKGAGGKKAKKGAAAAEPAVEDSKPATMKDAIEALKKADAGKSKSYKIDDKCHASGHVFEDYDCMLNQTNIGHNNNKYYVIQLIQNGSTYYTWNRWGRVGEPGQNSLKTFHDEAAAIKDFKKKFKDKTKNDWDKKDSFSPVAGKYTLIEMEGDDVDETDAAMAKLEAAAGVKKDVKVRPCKLDKETQSLVKLIFNHDMFKEAMASYDIDVKKMPLGKLSKTQIAKGFEVLEDMEEVLEKKKKGNMTELTSRFYTVIPHNFGRQRPPIISTMEEVRKKMDMLMVLADIELATAMQKEKEAEADADVEEVPHPDDVNYGLLQCDLTHIAKTSKEYKILDTYLKQTQGSWRAPKLEQIWKMDRHSEADRFKQHKALNNRKLLWHGTNVAVVAAICKGGLRIMPHSGGRVGKGIYHASENGKSACYVGCAGQTGIMFLNEVALGKEYTLMHDDWTLKKAPAGHDCIVARGHTEPDPKLDTKLKMDGNDVVVPQGKPIGTSFTSSSFSQSEYLTYTESQTRMRYLLKMKF